MGNTLTYGVSLSGGGARGILQLGILQALTEHAIVPSVVAGTSMGAINGALYAAGYEPKEIAKILKKHLKTLSFSWLLWVRSGFKSFDTLRKVLEEYISADNFDALTYPLYISVTNLNTGKNELISSGELFDYIIASASIPIIYKPKFIHGCYYVDGGLTNNFPARILQGKCDKIIGIHVNHIEEVKEFPNLISLVERMYRIGIYSNVSHKISACDYFIDPSEARKYDTFDFDKFDEIYDLGYKKGLELVKKIKEK